MTPSPVADLVLCNANVLTLSRTRPRAEVAAVRDGRILGLGEERDASAFSGPGTRVIDCRGRTIVPGFNDAHCHYFALVRKLLSIDCGPASVHSISDIVGRIRESAAGIPPGAWITAAGYDESLLMEKRHPTRQDLDKATTAHPVRLLHRTGRATVLNSLALSAAGIGPETEDPPGGLIDRQPGSGEPTGLLFQMNGLLEAVIPPPTANELHRGAGLADYLSISRGITTFQDASVTNDLSHWRAFQGLKERGEIRSRISMMPGFEALDGLTASGLSFRAGDEHLRLGAVKIVVDHTTGRLNPPQEELTRQVLRANRAGFQVALHAIDEDDIEAAITAIEASQSQGAGRGKRPRIEHCSVCPPGLLDRLARLEAVVVSQPPFIHFSGDRYLTEVESARRPWLYRFRAILRTGLPLAGSSDSPVADNNPLVGIYAAVTRRTEQGRTVGPGEKVSALQALRMYTLTPAYTSFDEEERGTLSPGKLADLVVLSADPTRVPPEELKGIRVEMTVIGGQIVYRI